MNQTISIHAAAENELNDAADFYDFESPELGETFISEIRKEDIFVRRANCKTIPFMGRKAHHERNIIMLHRSP